MDIEAVKDEVEKSYGFNIKSIDKIKNVYKIKNENDKEYCLKVIRYEFKHFYFIFSAMKSPPYSNSKSIFLSKFNAVITVVSLIFSLVPAK